MEFIVWMVHVLVAVSLIGLVLLQHGKGADMGAAFGSGASGSLFGASGSANFLSRTTAVLATAFFLSSMGLTYFSAKARAPAAAPAAQQSLPAAPQPVAPVVPANDAGKLGAIPK
ncbi:MAG: preprotein translocase subunit SecG [Gallionellaceae bacterium]|nr:preprotein translocase subunit SecG [Gallionellaceae bacterium]MDD5364317.1 preprotein translocase subunit SecG [Gallionellaceae bacterium]